MNRAVQLNARRSECTGIETRLYLGVSYSLVDHLISSHLISFPFLNELKKTRQNKTELDHSRIRATHYPVPLRKNIAKGPGEMTIHSVVIAQPLKSQNHHLLKLVFCPRIGISIRRWMLGLRIYHLADLQLCHWLVIANYLQACMHDILNCNGLLYLHAHTRDEVMQT